MSYNGVIDAMKKTAGSSIPVLWFIILFIATLSIAVISLSASQLQSRLLVYSQSGNPLSVWQIERVRKSWNIQSEFVNSQNSKAAKVLESYKIAIDADHKSTAELNIRQAQYEDALESLIAKISFLDSDIGDNLRNTPIDSYSRIETVVLKSVDQLLGSGQEPSHIETLKKLTADFRSAKNLRDQSKLTSLKNSEEVINIKRAVEDEQKLLEIHEKKLDDIVNSGGRLDSIEVHRVHDLISEFAFLENFAFGSLYRFSVLPNELLIIVLVVAMGILGSTLQLTYDYFKNGGVSEKSMFFLQPMLGAITAIVVFILLKAGVLVVTDSAKLGEVAPLNPFFISFVGIVSGLLSENALETIRKVGESWFKDTTVDSKARWAFGLKALMVEPKTVERLANRAGVSIELAQDWVDEKMPVPIEKQQVVSAWLDTDRRSIFSDIPPASLKAST